VVTPFAAARSKNWALRCMFPGLSLRGIVQLHVFLPLALVMMLYFFLLAKEAYMRHLRRWAHQKFPRLCCLGGDKKNKEVVDKKPTGKGKCDIFLKVLNRSAFGAGVVHVLFQLHTPVVQQFVAVFASTASVSRSFFNEADAIAALPERRGQESFNPVEPINVTKCSSNSANLSAFVLSDMSVEWEA